MKVSHKKVRKLGFFAALTMLIGTVVGIGIFFKNNSISQATHGNGLTWLLAWVVGGIIAAATAISFSEIGSLKTDGEVVKGLPAWSKKLVGKRFALFTKFNYSFFYFGALTAILGVFASEMIMQPLIVAGVINQLPIYAHALVGLTVVTFFIGINYISVRTSGIIQQITTIIKFVPLLVALIIGIVLPGVNHMGGSNAFNHGVFSLKGLIVALPAVLFAYDAFMAVTTLTDRVENAEKKIPLIILVGMLSVIVLYTLIALSSILHNAGFVSGWTKAGGPPGLIDNVLPTSAARTIGITTFVFITISTFGVINGISAATVALYRQNAEDETFFGMKALNKKIGHNFTSLVYIAATIIFWSLVVGIPSMIIKQDYLYDGFSNFPTLFFFCIYAILIFKYTLYRSKYSTKKINKYIYFTSAWIAIVGIVFVVGYLIFAHYINATLTDPNETSSWGLFASTSKTTSKVETTIFFVDLGVFMLFPGINYILKRKFETSKDSKLNANINEEKSVEITKVKKQ